MGTLWQSSGRFKLQILGGTPTDINKNHKWLVPRDQGVQL